MKINEITKRILIGILVFIITYLIVSFIRYDVIWVSQLKTFDGLERFRILMLFLIGPIISICWEFKQK